MEMLYVKAIERAKELLTKSPFDVYHTLDHHTEVVQNIFDIVKQEKINCDTQLLEIAAWWHDVFKDDPRESELLTEEFSNFGLDKEIQKISNIISGHSFSQEQQSVEAKLLYDADKIALVSIPRWRFAFNQFDLGLIPKEERDKYISEWNRRMPIMEAKLNFIYSRQIFRQKHTEFIGWLKSIDRYKNGLMI
jgi:hypothetical protein